MLRVILLCCLYLSLQSFIQCGDNEVVLEDYDHHRHIVEDGFKPAIFGSYSYDPVMQKFDRRPPPQRPMAIANSVHKPDDKVTGYTVTGKSTQLGNNVQVLKSGNKRDNIHPSTYWWAARAGSTAPTSRLTYKNENISKLVDNLNKLSDKYKQSTLEV